MADRDDAYLVRSLGGRKTGGLASGRRPEAMRSGEGRGALGSELAHADRAGVLDRGATVRVAEIQSRSMARRGITHAQQDSPQSSRAGWQGLTIHWAIHRMPRKFPMHNKPLVATGGQRTSSNSELPTRRCHSYTFGRKSHNAAQTSNPLALIIVGSLFAWRDCEGFSAL